MKSRTETLSTSASTSDRPSGPGRSGLSAQIGTAFACRLLINTARRFIYPFAPALSRGLGVPLTAVTAVIALNQFTGILGLIFGPLGDRWGYRLLMLTGLTCLALGMLTGGFFPFYAAFAVALILSGLAKSIFDPSILAFTGKHVPLRRRGLAVGIIEMSWAGSSLIGIPLTGLLIQGYGWRSPFFVMGGLAVLALVVLRLVMPGDRPGPEAPVNRLRDVWRLAVRNRSVLWTQVFAFCVNGANDALFVVYGGWLETSFGLSVAALGLATTVIGLAELSGEGLTAVLADRLGLRRSILLGLVLSGFSYLLLPLMGGNLIAGLTGLFFVFITVEFTIVTSLSYFTELLPDARATMMSGYFAAAGLGRVTGALVGGPAWLTGGMWAVGVTAALITAIAFAALLRGTRDMAAV